MHPQRLGPYDLGKTIGKGGMGSVYEAVDSLTGARVAIKALSPQLAQADGFRERFEAEIESLKTLRHEGIVRLFGYGEQDDALFYSMELVDGTSLEDELRAGRRFTWREVADIAIQLCRALKHAHDHGVVHRDIKPANILIDEHDRVKLADFGIARLFGTTQLTTAGGVLGTADYMSPEQADGRPVSDRCDQYSLGGVMYALLAGRAPFRARSLPEMLQLQRFAEPEPVRRYAQDTPEQMEHLIQQLLSKDPADRFPNTLVLARHLEAMVKALSRTAVDDFSLADDDLDPELADQSGQFPLSVTQADPQTHEEGQEPPDQRQLSGSFDGAANQDACTLAADGEELTPAKARSLSRPVMPRGESTTPATNAISRQSRSTYTSIEEEARQRQLAARDSLWGRVAQGAGMGIALVALIGFVWYLASPLSSDALFHQIEQAAATGNDELLREAEDEIDAFLNRFPDDERADVVTQYQARIERQQLKRRLQLRALTGAKSDQEILPIEELCVEALNVATRDPDRAVEMLKALVELFGPSASTPSAEGSDDRLAGRRTLCLELAQQELATLQDQIRAQSDKQLPLLQERMALAERLAPSDPVKANAMFQAIIGLYGEHGWANKIVNEAREKLPTPAPEDQEHVQE